MPNVGKAVLDSLAPLDLEVFLIGGVPHLRLQGCSDAELKSWLAMRAAQASFDFPVRGPDGTYRSGALPVADDEIAALARRKRLTAYRDTRSDRMHLHYRELVLRFHADVDAAERRRILARHSLATRPQRSHQGDDVIAYDADRVYGGKDLLDLCHELGALDAIAMAVPNLVSQFVRTDAVLPVQGARLPWHLDNINAQAAWDITRGSPDTVVAVLDDGVDLTHPGLRSNLLRDLDGRPFGRDYCFDDQDPRFLDPSPKLFGAPFADVRFNDIHGTPCAGLVASTDADAPGVAPDCSLLPVRIFHAAIPVSAAQVARAIRFAAANADVLSCSWCGDESPVIAGALEDAAFFGRGGRGTVVVCAAGNQAMPRSEFPASDLYCISVAAVDRDNVRLSDSNHGDDTLLVAPSASGQGKDALRSTDVAIDGFGFDPDSRIAGIVSPGIGGTSAAAPLVAGTVALMLAVNPRLTANEVAQLLATTTRTLTKDDRGRGLGNGLLDAGAAVLEASRA